MPPTAQDRLIDVLESISDIDELLLGMNLEQFKANKTYRMATERYLEIVCEATRNIPENIKSQAPEIAWKDIIDFGNRLRHAYHATDAEKVWLIIKNHLPLLKAFVERESNA